MQVQFKYLGNKFSDAGRNFYMTQILENIVFVQTVFICVGNFGRWISFGHQKT